MNHIRFEKQIFSLIIVMQMEKRRNNTFIAMPLYNTHQHRILR